MSWLWLSLYHALAMLWATFWALVLGFTISGVLQVFISKEQMQNAFGSTSTRSVLLATLLGAASSSCSYAAAAAGRSAIKQGAALIPAFAFMFASTNLVIELGIVLWLLMGWQFLLAEILGAFVLIGVMWLLMRLLLPRGVEREIQHRAQEEQTDSCEHEHPPSVAPATSGTASDHEQSESWTRVAHAFVTDWAMLWKEILGGFLIAGFIATLVPHEWWAKLFLQSGPTFVRTIENALVGPIIALLSFVCSVGNIPLASVLWSHGISFGGVIAFIYGDLVVVPLIIIYAKYYSARGAIWITAILFASMVIAGIIVDILFAAVGLIPTGARPPSALEHAHIVWNYTSWLDVIAAFFMAWLLFLHFKSRTRGEHEHCH